MEISSKEEELKATANYLTACLAPIVKSSEATLICFPGKEKTDFGYLAGEAVKRLGGMSIFPENDYRWKNLLRLAFRTKASTIIAPPLVVLGMTKIARYEKIPLYFYNVVLSGYPCQDWVMDGIAHGLDCRHWGLFAPGLTSIVAGFTCGCGTGFHLRDDKFEIVGDQGEALPGGSHGRVNLRLKEHPEAALATRLTGAFLASPCPCGNPAPKLVDIGMVESPGTTLVKAGEELMHWSSVLDCVLQRTPYGLDLEVVCFPGEKLPKFPSCAKLQVRPWNPERDCPLPLGAGRAMKMKARNGHISMQITS